MPQESNNNDPILSSFEPSYIEQTKKQIKEWIIKYPIDYWYRKKFNIAFGSPEHKSLTLLDMLYEYLEDDVIRSFTKRKKDNDNPVKHIEEDEIIQEDEVDSLVDMDENELDKFVEISEDVEKILNASKS